MVAARHLVVIASAETATTDALAERLRETCAVRTAYTTAEVLDRLDDEVDVVLVDPDLGTATVSIVTDAIACRELGCQVGFLADDRRLDDVPPAVDTVISPSLSDGHLRETVEWLAMRASYRKILDEYYTLMVTSADLARESGSGTATDLDRLQNHVDHLRTRLDETAAELDTVSLFEAALDGPSEE